MKKENKKKLLEIVKETVEVYVKTKKILDFDIKEEELKVRRGAFVTLHLDGKLKGCIGQIIPTNEPVWRVVRDVAIEASSNDPRLESVVESELENIEYEISVLSVPRKISNWKEIELGKHGVIIEKDYQGGIFLPQVATETGWNLEDFLSHLCSDKAGLLPDAYKSDLEVEIKVFEAEVFSNTEIS
jgi:AmmeMemoRadiSam system protein A